MPRRARLSATLSACSRPTGDRDGSLPPLPENRFCGVRGVSPCRSRTKVAIYFEGDYGANALEGSEWAAEQAGMKVA
ncbi:hypothetical protein, partial [Streptomyces tendae]